MPSTLALFHLRSLPYHYVGSNAHFACQRPLLLPSNPLLAPPRLPPPFSLPRRASLTPGVVNPPKKAMTDDKTGEPLIQRSDDNAETLKTRLSTYHTQTDPVVDYYKNKGLWTPIDAAQSPKLVWGSISEILTGPPTKGTGKMAKEE